MQSPRLPNDAATLSRFGYKPSALTPGSRKPAVFTCEFCGSNFESTLKAVSRSHSAACKRCRSIAASYTRAGACGDKRAFREARCPKLPDCIDAEATKTVFGYELSSLSAGSTRPVVAHCTFCLGLYQTSLCVLTTPTSTAACKKCDAVASHWSRLGRKEDRHAFWLRTRVNISGVNSAATLAEFGYDPASLSPFTTKKVIADCLYCKNPVRISMSKYAQREGNIACSACIRSKTVKTLETRYGVINTLDIPKVREKLSNPKTEQLIEILLQNAYKVKFVREYILGPYSFDFFVPESNLLIECQGDFFHGFKQYGYSGLPKDRAKASWVETHTGYKLVWIWEHELNLGRVKKVLDFHIGGCCEPPIDVKLVKLHFKKIQNSEAHAFLTQFHYLGNLGTIASCYGAYLEETLVAVCAFGGVTRAQSILKVNNAVGASYGPKQLKELRRFCIRPNARTKNMGSYCLRRFLHAYAQDFKDVLAILSFSDTTVDDAGTIYKASNWKQLPSTSLSYHYLDINSGKRIHKRTVWDSARQNHMTESEFVRQAGLEKIIEEPKTVWLAVL